MSQIPIGWLMNRGVIYGYLPLSQEVNDEDDGQSPAPKFFLQDMIVQEAVFFFFGEEFVSYKIYTTMILSF